MAKHILHSHPDEFDFLLFGLVCQEDQYRTVSLLNDALNIDLSLMSFLQYSLKDGNLFNFSLYSFSDEELFLEFNLIPNTSNYELKSEASGEINSLFAGQTLDESVRLIKELPQTDYFLMIKGDELHHYEFRLADELRKIPEILQIQSVKPDDLPSKKNLIF